MDHPQALAQLTQQLRELQEAVRSLHGENARLRQDVDALRGKAPAAALPASPSVSAADGVDFVEKVRAAAFSRRSLLSKAPVLAAGALAACAAEVKANPSADGGPDANDNGADAGACECPTVDNAALKYMAFDQPLVNPQVLDCPVVWQRKHADPGPGYVSSILTLEQESDGPNAYPWPLFVKVTATPDPAATMSSANAFGVLARLINNGPGFGAPFFSDLQHGGAGTDIGFDCELVSTNPGGRTIGLNILNAGNGMPASDHNGSQAINIQSGPGGRGWDTAIHLEKAAGTESAGERGIGIDAKFGLGIDMGDNNLKLNKGAKVYLDENQTVFLWLNPDNNRLEFRYLNQVLGYLKLDSVEHEM